MLLSTGLVQAGGESASGLHPPRLVGGVLKDAPHARVPGVPVHRVAVHPHGRAGRRRRGHPDLLEQQLFVIHRLMLRPAARRAVAFRVRPIEVDNAPAERRLRVGKTSVVAPPQARSEREASGRGHFYYVGQTSQMI